MPWSTRSRKSSRSAPSNRNPPIEEALTPPQQEYFFPGRFLLGEIPVQLPKYGLREPAADASPRPDQRVNSVSDALSSRAAARWDCASRNSRKRIPPNSSSAPFFASSMPSV